MATKNLVLEWERRIQKSAGPTNPSLKEPGRNGGARMRDATEVTKSSTTETNVAMNTGSNEVDTLSQPVANTSPAPNDNNIFGNTSSDIIPVHAPEFPVFIEEECIIPDVANLSMSDSPAEPLELPPRVPAFSRIDLGEVTEPETLPHIPRSDMKTLTGMDTQKKIDMAKVVDCERAPSASNVDAQSKSSDYKERLPASKRPTARAGRKNLLRHGEKPKVYTFKGAYGKRNPGGDM